MARIPQDLLDEFKCLSSKRRARLFGLIEDRLEGALDRLDKVKEPFREIEALRNASQALNQLEDATKKRAEVRQMLFTIFSSETGDQERDGPAIQIIVNTGDKKDEEPSADE